jgi:predicted tellurium resistance membrane protein TerC
MVSRLALLMAISLILKLKSDLFTIFGQGISGKDIILILGGLFLLYKSTVEIYHKMEGDEKPSTTRVKSQKLMTVLLQILIMDMVFSLDSIITAIGLVDQIWIMYIAIVIAVGVMMFAAYPISNFVKDHPSFKILALAFLLLIGFSLVSEGFDVEIPKGYIYFAMFFSLMVDLLQMKMSKKQENESV